MCSTCGCGSGEVRIEGGAHAHAHAPGLEPSRMLRIEQDILRMLAEVTGGPA